MAHHKVKSWSYLYQAIKSGAKTHDVRDMTDRPYKVGDTMTLCEFDQTAGTFTGDETKVEITYITDRNIPCAYSSAVLAQDYGILSVRLLASNCARFDIARAVIEELTPGELQRITELSEEMLTEAATSKV